MTSSLSAATLSRLVLPVPALAGCIRAMMWRDTRAATLSEAQRYNHFPASPMCSLTWWFTGESLMLPPGVPAAPQAPRTPLPSRWIFAGPTTRPVISWNPGPLHALMVLLPPDALHRLTGLDVAAWVNRWDDAATVLPPDWAGLGRALADAPDDDTRLVWLQDFLAPRWQEMRPVRWSPVQRYLDWAQSLALHAALGGPGRSLRQLERRIKRWAGQPMRELRGIGRGELAFLHTRSTIGQGAPNWAALADESGYADQSHLCRETRRITGCSPDELYRRVLADESFWAYRLWE